MINVLKKVWEIIEAGTLSVIALAGLGLAIFTAIGLQDMQSTISAMDTKLIRSETTAESGLITSKIATMSYPAYKAQAQREASYYKASPYFLALNADGVYELTTRGENLISPEIRNEVQRLIMEKGDISDKDILLCYGIRSLVEHAFLDDVPPVVMMGVMVTYLEGR